MGSHPDLIAIIVTSLLPMILSLAFHEWGHAAVAVALGDETPREQGRLTLNPIAHMDPIGTLVLPLVMSLSGLPPFGWAKPVQVSPRRFTRRITMTTGMMLTAVAGPAMNLLIALIAALFVAGSNHPGGVGAQYIDLAERIFSMNVMLFVFNLLPVPPLDGSRVLFGLLPSDLRGRYASLEQYSTVFLMLLFAVGGRFIVGPSIAVAHGIGQFTHLIFP